MTIMIKNIANGFIWRVVAIYGPAYEENKKEFIDELHCIMGCWDGPTLLGGDFNIVRNQREKSNGVINFNLVELFNEWIDRWALIDLKDPARGFTWTNNQEKPIMATLDRILVTTHWEAKYPLAKTTILPRGVSDQNPVMITFGEKAGGDLVFRFEKWWFEVDGFENLVKESWDNECLLLDPVDRWQFKMRNLRRKIKGWSWNINDERRKSKEKIMGGGGA
jgi:hypothetical protein